MQIGRKVYNTLGKVTDIGTKLLPMAETGAAAMGYGPEVWGFEGARKGLDIIKNAKNTVDTLRHQGRAFTAGGIPPAQIKTKYNYSDVHNLNSLFKGN